MDIREFLKTNKIIMDGAMGTYYGSLYNSNLVSEFANISNPDLVVNIHTEYMNAGANMIRTNSFAANKEVLKVSDWEQVNIIKASYINAKKAVEKQNNKVYIACDIGPIPVRGDRDEDDLLKEYKLICNTFLEENPEIILFETFSDFEYIHKLLPYIKEKEPEVFIITNFCLNKNGYTSSGISASAIFEEISINPYINAGGFNCGIGSGHMYQILKKLTFPENKFIVASPNAGYPEQYSNRMIFMDNEGYFGGNMSQIEDLGVDIIGGCCGTSPKYINYLKKQIRFNHSNRGVRIKGISSKGAQSELKKNDFYELFQNGKKVVAVELDPPFDACDDKILECANKLKSLGTDIITIADSPMGRSRVDSVLMGIKISKEVNINVMPHMCCRDKNLIAIRSSVLGAYVNGVRNLLFVTGDPIPSEQRQSTTGVFDYNSVRLMSFMEEMNKEHFSKEPIYFGGALNYGRGNIDKVIERMEQKIKAGAKYFLTQPIYSDEDIERIRYIKERVDTKILCGIMPLVSYRNANFIKNEITGINVPDDVVNRYHIDMTKEEGEIVGAKIASEIIEKLSPFADGYYFMLPFNRVSLMEKIRIE